ncbi:MAG: adenosine kinase [Planctomycetaceae bacterium]
MTLDVYGVGNTLVDIQVQVSDDLLASLGFAKGVMTLVDRETQERVLDALGDLPRNQSAGGSAANTILGVAGLGGRTAYAGKIGDDPLGHFCLEDMRQNQVTVDVPFSDGPTGTCVVLITDDAQRTMLTYLGVSADVGPDDVAPDLVTAARAVYVEGYLFSADTPRQAAYQAISAAETGSGLLALTVSDAFLIDLFRDEFLDLVAGPVDLLFCNEEEARSLLQIDDTHECARRLGAEVERVAITLGADGAMLIENQQVIRVAGVPADAIDTTGAGDMFAAGILYGLTNGMTFEQSARLANHAAARVVTQLGARLNEPIPADQILRIAGLSDPDT